jgi:O-antigen/teichoic acid export membrane protein
MHHIKRDLIANFGCRAWMALLAVLLTPVYVNLLGIESYGLIGFYNSLFALFSIMDFGLGDSFCREIARKENPIAAATIARTLELVYWSLGALIALTFILSTPWISQKWLNDQNSFSHERLSYLLKLMALSFFFFWPYIFYSKGLQGMQAHITNNSIQFMATGFRYLGSWVVLLIFPSIELFFYWQIASSILMTSMALIATWKKLSMNPMKVHFSFATLSSIWKFSLGMSAIGITSLIMQQVDKFIVSHLFSLEKLGYYCFSFTLASSLYYFVQPLSLYFYPLFVQAVEKQDLIKLKALYITARKLVFIIVGPYALLLMIFSNKIVLLWTANSVMAQQCAPLITLLTAGIFLHSYMTMPFNLQFAFGQTRAIIYQNLLFILLFIPICYVLAQFFGLAGVASFVIFLNLGYILFNLKFVNQKLMATQ